MKTIVIKLASFLMLSAVHPALLAAEQPVERDIQELEVTGTRNLYLLQEEIDIARERMFSMYNELNEDDRYDIRCRLEAPLGTKLKRNVCRPGFTDEIDKGNGRAMFDMVTGSAFADMPRASRMILARELPVLEQKIMEAILQSPELAEATRELNELEEEYQQRTSTALNQD